MPSRTALLRVIYPETTTIRGRRFTQDTPIVPDVWIEYAVKPGIALELLVVPNKHVAMKDLLDELRQRMEAVRGSKVKVAYNESHVLLKATLEELIAAVLPMSFVWNKEELGFPPNTIATRLRQLLKAPELVRLLMDPVYRGDKKQFSPLLLDIVRIAGAVVLGADPPPANFEDDQNSWQEYLERAVEALLPIVEKIPPRVGDKPPRFVWNVFLNRQTEGSVHQSHKTIKADAAVLLFAISCKSLKWAVIDSGIDKDHEAFHHPKRPGESRVLRTFDFTRLSRLMLGGVDAIRKELSTGLNDAELARIDTDIEKRVAQGLPVDWQLLTPLLEIEHQQYKSPEHEHGTHVAGIIAGNSPAEASERVVGVCPDLELFDLRVTGKEGRGDEFSILAALQYVRFLNQGRDSMLVHGVNISMSLKHQVDSFACGATPACMECDRVVESGVVVVVAAGNRGFNLGQYCYASITDPGNAESVITVGATHRTAPHKFGVSYFSSRGPTGDGRRKPDLLAPGEKIDSAIPGGKVATLDGTSMAAPHVSGAAALLMARHRELIGKPRRIKDILCRTATDLGREPYFQGAGVVDVLRALQSV